MSAAQQQAAAAAAMTQVPAGFEAVPCMLRNADGATGVVGLLIRPAAGNSNNNNHNQKQMQNLKLSGNNKMLLPSTSGSNATTHLQPLRPKASTGNNMNYGSHALTVAVAPGPSQQQQQQHQQQQFQQQATPVTNYYTTSNYNHINNSNNMGRTVQLQSQQASCSTTTSNSTPGAHDAVLTIDDMPQSDLVRLLTESESLLASDQLSQESHSQIQVLESSNYSTTNYAANCIDYAQASTSYAYNSNMDTNVTQSSSNSGRAPGGRYQPTNHNHNLSSTYNSSNQSGSRLHPMLDWEQAAPSQQHPPHPSVPPPAAQQEQSSGTPDSGVHSVAGSPLMYTPPMVSPQQRASSNSTMSNNTNYQRIAPRHRPGKPGISLSHPNEQQQCTSSFTQPKEISPVHNNSNASCTPAKVPRTTSPDERPTSSSSSATVSNEQPSHEKQRRKKLRKRRPRIRQDTFDDMPQLTPVFKEAHKDDGAVKCKSKDTPLDDHFQHIYAAVMSGGDNRANHSSNIEHSPSDVSVVHDSMCSPTPSSVSASVSLIDIADKIAVDKDPTAALAAALTQILDPKTLSKLTNQLQSHDGLSAELKMRLLQQHIEHAEEQLQRPDETLDTSVESVADSVHNEIVRLNEQLRPVTPVETLVTTTKCASPEPPVPQVRPRLTSQQRAMIDRLHRYRVNVRCFQSTGDKTDVDRLTMRLINARLGDTSSMMLPRGDSRGRVPSCFRRVDMNKKVVVEPPQPSLPELVPPSSGALEPSDSEDNCAAPTLQAMDNNTSDTCERTHERTPPSLSPVKQTTVSPKSDQEQRVSLKIRLPPSVKRKSTPMKITVDSEQKEMLPLKKRKMDKKKSSEMRSAFKRCSKCETWLSVDATALRQTLCSDCDTSNPETPEKPKLHDLNSYKRIKTNVYTDQPPTWPSMSECVCTSQCDADCLNRIMFVECTKHNCAQTDDTRCSNRRIQRRQRCANMKMFPTNSQRGQGVKATENIATDTFLCEYVGDVVATERFVQRMQHVYSQYKHHYALMLDAGYVIDAYTMGNTARMFNHSCHPNVVVQKWNVNGQHRIGLFAVRDIHPNEELCYDYRFNSFDAATDRSRACLCGAQKCRQTISSSSAALSPQVSPRKQRANAVRERKIAAEHRLFLMRHKRLKADLFTLLSTPSKSAISPISTADTSSESHQKSRASLIKMANFDKKVQLVQFCAQLIDAVKQANGDTPRIRRIEHRLLTAHYNDPVHFDADMKRALHKMTKAERPQLAYDTIKAQLTPQLRDSYTIPVSFNPVQPAPALKTAPEDKATSSGSDGFLTKTVDLSYVDGVRMLPIPVADDAAVCWPIDARNVHGSDSGDCVRCVCGIHEDEGGMVQCDRCNYWLHVDCIQAKGDVDYYECAYCKQGSALTPSVDVPLSEQPSDRLMDCTYYKTLVQEHSKLQVRVDECVYVRRTITDEDKQRLNRFHRSCVAANKTGCKEHNKKKKASKSSPDQTRDRLTRRDVRVFRVDRLFTAPDGGRFVFGFYYARPHETFCEPSRRFHKKELLCTPIYDTLPLSCVVNRCLVLDSKQYTRGRPKLPVYDELDVFLCEFRVDKQQRQFTAMRNKHERMRYVCSELPHLFTSFPQPTKILRQFTPFVMPGNSAAGKTPEPLQPSSRTVPLDVIRNRMCALMRKTQIGRLQQQIERIETKRSTAHKTAPQ